jgi:excisionase family DNA binding protein
MRGVSRQAIARLIKKGRLRVLEIGGKVLVNRSEIEAFMPEPPGRPANERIARSNQKTRKSLSIEELEALRAYLRALMPHRLESEWGIDADTILSAISRSTDLTKRGVRGIIAEAVFERDVAPKVATSGWETVPITGDLPYDALFRKGEISARVQIKLQRLEKGVPKLYHPKHYEEGSLYVVEVQKTRSGEKTTVETLQGSRDKASSTASVTIKTRPYRFGEFDILAVNMHPSSGDWRSFRYTLGAWLLPRVADVSLVEVFQPVAAAPNDVWTDGLATCLRWLEAGEKHRVLAELLHLPKKR